MDDQIAARLLNAIDGGQLVILCGAGLSMANPSNLPSANQLAVSCYDRYARNTGLNLPEDLRTDIEAQARYFKNINEFVSTFVRILIPWDKFRHRPNRGHEAIADFLACKAIEWALTTNLDTLIEDAAAELGENDFRAAFDRQSLFRTDYIHNLLLKLHGCCVGDREHTVWCREQLEETIIADTIEAFRNWIIGRLPEHDLLIVGFWSDWAYLNTMLVETISQVEPRSVFLVDPSDADVLAEKAPELWEWANGPHTTFHHVQESGDYFLDELRHRFSKQFLEKVISRGVSAYEQFYGPPSNEMTTFNWDLKTSELYSFRRYFTGLSSGEIVRIKQPSESHELIGLCHLLLIRQGASLNAFGYEFNGETIRLVYAAGNVLSSIKDKFKNESVPVEPDVTVGVGAYDEPTPNNIVRGEAISSIVRHANVGKWITYEGLRDKIGLN